MKTNKFLIFFKRSPGGYQAFVSIEREPTFSWPHVGILRKGREMSREECIRYTKKYVDYSKATDSEEYEYIIDESGLNESEVMKKCLQAKL